MSNVFHNLLTRAFILSRVRTKTRARGQYKRLCFNAITNAWQPRAPLTGGIYAHASINKNFGQI